MKLVLALVTALTLTPLLAETCPECPVPKSPTCSERIARAKAHGCVLAPEIVTVTKEVPGPERIVVKEVFTQVPGPVKIVKEPFPVYTEVAAKGHFILGGGPMYFHDMGSKTANWGGTVVVGYQTKGGLQFQVGPTYMRRNGVDGTVTGCRSGEPNAATLWPPICDVAIPYHVDGGTPWGAQALILFAF